jgi:hypothetical protein
MGNTPNASDTGQNRPEDNLQEIRRQINAAKKEIDALKIATRRVAS